MELVKQVVPRKFESFERVYLFRELELNKIETSIRELKNEKCPDLTEFSGVLQANVACGWPHIFENVSGCY
jgi:hypothetical protein